MLVPIPGGARRLAQLAVRHRYHLSLCLSSGESRSVQLMDRDGKVCRRLAPSGHSWAALLLTWARAELAARGELALAYATGTWLRVGDAWCWVYAPTLEEAAAYWNRRLAAAPLADLTPAMLEEAGAAIAADDLRRRAGRVRP